MDNTEIRPGDRLHAYTFEKGEFDVIWIETDRDKAVLVEAGGDRLKYLVNIERLKNRSQMLFLDSTNG